MLYFASLFVPQISTLVGIDEASRRSFLLNIAAFGISFL